MLNIYLSRENINKNHFIFNQINSTPGHKILLVPDQYTLQSERDSFTYLGKSAIIDLEVLSPSRLGYKLLKETGMPKGTLLDNYGRHMLLFRIMQKKLKDLEQFRNMINKPGFIELINEQIAEFQQHYIDSQKLSDTNALLEADSLLHSKLKDLGIIYEEYEKQIAEKYIDTTDINEIFINAAKKSDFIKNCSFWVKGFDYLAPKNLTFLMQLVKHSLSVNIFLTGDLANTSKDKELFEATEKLVYKLQNECDSLGLKYNIQKISHDFPLEEKAEFVKHIEQEIFAFPFTPCKEKIEGLHLHYSKNAYTEAETAATYIRKLLREKSLKPKDIAVICNDEYCGNIAKRTFEEYGISCFLDQNKDVLSNKVLSLNMALLRLVSGNLSTSSILSFIKTGFSDLSQDEIYKLENYVKKYKIKGNMWLKEFYKTDKNSPFSISIEEINAIREKLIPPLLKFRQAMSVKAANLKIQALYDFLSKDVKILDKLKEKIREEENLGLHEKALENSQIWNMLINLYEQFALILKDEEISNESMEEILKSGFSSIKIGMIPSTGDTVIIGTMQRSRIGDIPVLIVLDAGEGILPLSINPDTLITDDEKISTFEKTGVELGNPGQMLMLEEKLAIYRMFSSPSKELFVSYQLQSLAAEPKKPSQIFLRLTDIFPKNPVKGDIYSYEQNLALILSPSHILKHIAEKLQKGTDLHESEIIALNWIFKNNRDKFQMLLSGLNFEIIAKRLQRNTSKDLFLSSLNTLKLSPSRLENYSRCPFAYFLNYGIKPDKNEVFELSSREFGDIYHNCAQKISEKLSADGLKLTDPASKWQKITEEEIDDLVTSIIEEETSRYKDGLIFDVEEGNYKIERIKTVCKQVISAIIFQVRAGQIEKLMSELVFGKNTNASLPAIELDCGFPITIEGKIDRLDLLKGNYCKIIDYKSGSTSFDKDSALGGFQLQLAIYLTAYLSANPESKAGGMFYFKFASENINLKLDESTDTISDNMLKEYKLDGIFLNSEDVINALDSEFSGFSKVANIRKTKEGIKYNEKSMMEESEFAEFLTSISNVISKLCIQLSEGNIDIYPAKIQNRPVCEFCDFTSICKFDKNLPNCKYRKSW